jgi:hypothetical protein
MSVFHRLTVPIALFVFLGLAMSCQACPFCGGDKGLPLVAKFDEAEIVLYGHCENARISGETDLIIEKVLKSHEMIKGKTKITLPQHIPDSSKKFIVFVDVYKGRFDPTFGMQLTDNTEMLRYLEGVMKLKGKSQPERLRFAFDYLNSAEIEVAMDAYREFARADYRDYKDIAKKLPADTIAGWLKDPKTPSFRYGLYASLLGHCGDKDHAKLLLAMINDPVKRRNSGLFGIMASYAMLEPTKGWALIQEVAVDKDKPFLVRHAALLTMQFIWESRRDLVKQEDVVKGVANVLTMADTADFAIEDLRKWRRWEYCDQVIDLFDKKSSNSSYIRKSVLRYALQCKSERAVAFVKAQRARDKDWVEEIEDSLKMEPEPVLK